MNIFGVSRKRKLDQLEDEVKTLDAEKASKNELSNTKVYFVGEIADINGEIDDIKNNPLALSSGPRDPPGWLFAYDGNGGTNWDISTDGILIKGSALLGPNEHAFTEVDLSWMDTSRYNFIVKYTVNESNAKKQLYAGFCSKASHLARRDGTSAPVNDGWGTHQYNNNGLGYACEFRLTPSYTAASFNTYREPHDGFKYADSNDVKSSNGGRTLTVTVTDAKIVSIMYEKDTANEFEYLGNGSIPSYIPVPLGPFHMYFHDSEPTPAFGGSDYDIKFEILETSPRRDYYTLDGILKQLSPYAEQKAVILDAVHKRFIPLGCEVAQLAGFTSTGNIDDNTYFMPRALYIGQRLTLINTSGTNLTLYDYLPENPFSTTSTWNSTILQHSGNNDHFEYVALDTEGSWHRLI